ncbi:MAG: AMMECR1 domain-containing protein, partial [Clostridiales bacterium]|nr:AMMECR1 domain-containing protein [Clostridiales bacterium]
GTRDPRFPPVEEFELNDLEYSVDVLGAPEAISDQSELDPIRYGVIVSHQGRHGLLLPNLDGVDTVDHQLSIALSKAGIPEDVDYSMERFEVIRHK